MRKTKNLVCIEKARPSQFSDVVSQDIFVKAKIPYKTFPVKDMSEPGCPTNRR